LNTPRSPLVVTADKAYDSQTARQQIKDEGALPIIPGGSQFPICRCQLLTLCRVARYGPDANKGAQALRPQRPHYGSVGAAGLSIPSTCYACAKFSVCVSRSAALNHLSAHRDEAASSSRRDARGTHTRCRQVLSYRCVGDVPGSAEHAQKSALFVMAILDTGGVGRARCRTTCRRVGSHDQPTPHCQEATWRRGERRAAGRQLQAPTRAVRSQTAGPDQCEHGVSMRSHKKPWRRARALDGGPNMIMTSIGEAHGVLH